MALPFPIRRRLTRFAQVDNGRRLMLAEAAVWLLLARLALVFLPQAMAARVMLKRRGVASVMHFGAAKGTDKPLDTHAWLDAAGVDVTGYPVAENFSEIACFV